MIEAIIDDHLKRFARVVCRTRWLFTMSNTIVVLRSNLVKASSPEPTLQRLQSRSWCPLQPAQLQKHIKEAYTKLIEKVIEPLRVGEVEMERDE